MTNPDYQNNQALLTSVDYLNTIKKRDEIFQKIHSLENQFNPKFVDLVTPIEERKQLFQDIKLLEKEVELRQENFNSLKKVAEKYKLTQDAKILQLEKKKYKDIQDVELRKRKFQILQYQNYLNDETKHLLWVLFVILLIDCFIVLGNLLKIPGFEKTAVLALIFGSLGIFGVYLFKKLVVDNVNINIYHIDRHNYKKPTDAELTRDKQLKDKLSALKSQSSNYNQNCPGQPNTEYQDIKFEQDRVIDEIEASAEIEDGNCIQLTV